MCWPGGGVGGRPRGGPGQRQGYDWRGGVGILASWYCQQRDRFSTKCQRASGLRLTLSPSKSLPPHLFLSPSKSLPPSLSPTLSLSKSLHPSIQPIFSTFALCTRKRSWEETTSFTLQRWITAHASPNYVAKNVNNWKILLFQVYVVFFAYHLNMDINKHDFLFLSTNIPHNLPKKSFKL